MKVNRCYPVAPLVGVAGIVCRDGEVLLIRRGKAPGKGEWNIPGGLVELGESLKEAVRREIHEETGLEVVAEDLFKVSDRIIRDGSGRVRYHYVLLDYLCRVVGGQLRAASDAADVRWVTASHLHKMGLSVPVKAILEEAEKVTNGFMKRGNFTEKP